MKTLPNTLERYQRLLEALELPEELDNDEMKQLKEVLHKSADVFAWMTQSCGVRTWCIMSLTLVTIHLCSNLPTGVAVNLVTRKFCRSEKIT